MYTQALNSGGGLAQRLNQHFYFKAIRVWDLSAMPFHQSGAGCFFLFQGLTKPMGPAPLKPPDRGVKVFRVFFRITKVYYCNWTIYII